MSHDDLNAHGGGSHSHIDGSDQLSDRRRLSIHPRMRMQRKSLVGAVQAETLKERQVNLDLGLTVLSRDVISFVFAERTITL